MRVVALGSFLKNAVTLCAMLCGMAASPVFAADATDGGMNMTDPTPFAQQKPAVDGLNFKASAVTGVIGGYANHMFIASVATPMPFINTFGAQLDLGIGNYREDYTSAAAGLHLFWRDPDTGLLGIYGDWGYVNPEHAGRMGVEASLYNDRWTLDVFAGVQFGQHVMTEFVDEVDLSYYFSDNLRGSVGHRLISRGHVANIGFEYMPEGSGGWSVFGEAEAGQDEYHSAWLGLRYSFGQSGANTLIERDRVADPIVRIPRNLASVTRCGTIADPANYYTSWNGFETMKHDHLCADKDELDRRGADEDKK
ncbi:MAG: hypothetical protein KDJ80_14540 [Nitratireductor sp.]|nr:hypothetical protein [Nitratireductor sp.]